MFLDLCLSQQIVEREKGYFYKNLHDSCARHKKELLYAISRFKSSPLNHSEVSVVLL